ncbi:MAG: pyridoxamine 5'-phosphate oxidase [Bdellovibrionota bacterium]
MIPLSLFDFQETPYVNFGALFQEIKRHNVPDPNAMTLATVSSRNQPTARVVLFKGFYGEGWGFFTNYQGRKATELAHNSQVGANFFWAQMAVQVRIDGFVEKLTREQNEEYFDSRPRLSQLGAWASDQSKELTSRDEIENKLKEVESKFDGKDIPCPPHWGGFRILAREIEFWFGVEGRLHHRYVYSRQSKESFFEDPAQIQWKRWMKNP